MKQFLLSLIALAFLSCSAEAATCYWVGGTGNFDNSNTASWANASGGTTGTCAATGGIPKNSADFAIFDGSSGGGTVTVCGTASANCPSASGSVNISGITFGAFTGTLDFATRNPAVTLSTTFSGTGTGTRTLSMGNGVWTFGGGSSATWNFVTTTNLTLNINSSSIVWVGASTGSNFFGGAKTWGALTINANSSNPSAIYQIEPNNTANNTFSSLTVNAPANISMRSGATQTFTGGITVSGGSLSSMVSFMGDGVSAGVVATVAVGAVSNVAYTVWRGAAGATSAINATNSINLATPATGLGTLSITTPASGGGGRIIGG